MVVILSKYVTVSVKIRREIKAQLEKTGTKPSKLLKEAIEETLRKQEIERITKDLAKMKKTLAKISMQDVVRSIREDRDSR